MAPETPEQSICTSEGPYPGVKVSKAIRKKKAKMLMRGSKG